MHFSSTCPHDSPYWPSKLVADLWCPMVFLRSDVIMFARAAHIFATQAVLPTSMLSNDCHGHKSGDSTLYKPRNHGRCLFPSQRPAYRLVVGAAVVA